ncbi:MAG: lactate racemase domain-containing protein, partial [Synergistaceae bacterium]
MAAQIKTMNTSSFTFLGGDADYTASVPSANLLKIAKREKCKTEKPTEIYVADKLAHSSGLSSLKELIGSQDKVLIICDDITRPTPTSKILPFVTEYLEHIGIKLSNQFILFANGSHRHMSDEEAFLKIGARLWGKIPWANHDWNAELCRIGMTPSGIPIDVNPLLGKYGCIIGIGSVFPHRYCGWSGGGKIIIPGVSGPETISRTHWLPYYDNSISLGASNTKASNEIMAAAKTAGLSFLIQCVCDGDGNITDIFADTPEKAHRAAVEKAKSAMAVPVPISDVVIAQAWPEESDLWQAGKALYAAENIVADGGHIIVAASLKDGIGPHKTFAELINADTEKILSCMNKHNAEGL